LEQADGIDRNAGILQFAARLIESNFAEGIDAGRQNQNGFAAFDFRHAVGGIGQRVKEIGFGKIGKAERAQALVEHLLVIGEIGNDSGAEIVADEGDVIIRLHRVDECAGGLERVVPVGAAVPLETLAEFDDHGYSHGRLADGKFLDGLRNVVYEDAEDGARQVGNKIVFVIHHRDVDGDEIGLGRKSGGRGTGIPVLWPWRQFGWNLRKIFRGAGLGGRGSGGGGRGRGGRRVAHRWAAGPRDRFAANRTGTFLREQNGQQSQQDRERGE